MKVIDVEEKVVPNLDSRVLYEINEDNFTQKQFSSNNRKVLDNIVIDLKKQTIKVPEVEPAELDGVFHHNVSSFCIYICIP